MSELRDYRTISLIGEEAFGRLKNTEAVIIGVGGVGGHAADSLVRAGIGNIVLIDFDTFDETNINRQLGALMSTVGRHKTEVLAERFKDINPDIKIKTVNEMLTADNVEELLKRSGYVLDMCDDIYAKNVIYNYCLKNNIKFISAMGAGNRLDISRLNVTTLDKTRYCSLAKRMRRLVDKSIQNKIRVLYYDDEPISVKGTVGTISYSPAYMGIRTASEVIRDIIEV